jgi:hypothetical protein
MSSTQGANRELVTAADAADLQRAGVLVTNERRQRPRWFDGRFLAARDLIREQNYFLTREADLGRAIGSGIAAGLAVSAGRSAQTLSVAAGHGITPNGELVLLEHTLDLRLADIPRVEQLSGRFGLGRIPTPSLRSRNGLFALALRPVEFTANPIGAYPTSITGQRTVEDGDIIEGTAIVLIPWPDDGAGASLDARRSQAARAVFVDRNDRGLASDLLPLAMIALDNNTLAWIDMPMLRRELGADRGDLPGLGLAPRALRFAHLLQHQQHMADVIEANGGRGFPASSQFPVLPPAGPLPPGVIQPRDFTQSYFPPTLAVEFSIIPEDELPALVEESLALPGFDFSADDEVLGSGSVLVLAPVPRNEWNSVLSRLDDLRRKLRPAAPNQVAARKPLDILMGLGAAAMVGEPLDPATPSDAEWQRLARLDTLWFVRRRNLAYHEDLAGTARRIAGRERSFSPAFSDRIAALGLSDRLNTSLERATPAARNEITNLLASERFTASPTLTAAAIGEFERAETLDQAAALRTVSVMTAPQTGSGLTRLDATEVAADPQVLANIAARSDWQRIDRDARVAPRTGVVDIGRGLRTTRP